MNRPQLHVITDETVQQRFSHAELGRLVVEAGADFVQYREKRTNPRDDPLAVTTILQEVCAQSHFSRLIINDNVELARQVSATGVHLGDEDMSVEEARRLLGTTPLIGRTCNSLAAVLKANQLPCDYIGVGPVFDTTSKSNPSEPLGLTALRSIVENSTKPVIAIGGITLANLPSVLQTGIQGVAVLAAIVAAHDPGKEANNFLNVLESSAINCGSV